MTQPADLPRIDGYKVEREIGRGGFSRVYEAEQTSVARKVAIKVLKERLTDDAAARGFEQECKAMGAVRHPNVVSVRDAVFTVDRRPCIVMELYSRGNYGTRLSQQGALPVHELLQLGIKIAAGLGTAHDLNIVHGDVKPRNIFRSQFGEVALGDFGIATVDYGDASEVVGFTPHYAAPELIEDGTSAASPLSDQYSLAATIFHLAVGMRPFYMPGKNDTDQVLLRVISAPTPVLPDDLGGAELREVIAKAMAREPLDRYEDMEAFARALARVERLLKLAPTPIMIGTDEDNTIEALVVEETEVASQPAPAPTVTAEIAPPVEEVTPATQAGVEPAPEPAAVEVDPAPATSVSDEPSGMRTVLAAVALVAAAGIIGLFLAFGGDGESEDPATPDPAATVEVFDDDFYAVVEPVDDVAGVLDGDTARFTWSSSNDSAKFEVTRTDGPSANTSRTVDDSSITYVSLEDGERPCVQVRTVNATNGSVSQWSGTTCAEESEGS